MPETDRLSRREHHVHDLSRGLCRELFSVRVLNNPSIEHIHYSMGPLCM
jgi:hypothetical protein